MINHDLLLDWILDEQMSELEVGISAMTDVNAVTQDDRWNLLHLSTVSVTENASPRVLKMFLENGVQPNAADREGYRPIHFLARKNDVAGIRCLMEHGADSNVQNEKGETPLYLSIARNPVNLEAVELLLSTGADPNLGGEKSASTLVNQQEFELRPETLSLFKKWTQ